MGEARDEVFAVQDRGDDRDGNVRAEAGEGPRVHAENRPRERPGGCNAVGWDPLLGVALSASFLSPVVSVLGDDADLRRYLE